ncbi:MAG: hypothetical protein RR356_01355 [Bacteroidales bacterium]
MPRNIFPYSCVSGCNEKPGMEHSGMRTCSGKRDGEAGTPYKII